MDNLHNKLNFNLVKKKRNSRKEPFKSSKIPNLVENVVMCGKYSLTKFANFLIIVLRAEIVTTFGSKMVTVSSRNTITRKFANFARYIFRKIIFGIPRFLARIGTFGRLASEEANEI